MAPALNTQVALMLRAPWQWQLNDGSIRAFAMHAGLATLLVGLPALASMFWLPGAWARVWWSVLAAITLLAVWGVQFSALLQLDHPHSARFVAGHGRALRATALALWLALVSLVAVVAGVALDLPGADHPFHAVALVALVAAAAFLYVALALRFWWLWVALWLPFPFIGQLRVLAATHPVAAGLRDLWLAQPLLASLVLLLAMAAALLSLFGKGDTRHARVYASHENVRKITTARATGQKPPLDAYGRWGEVVGKPFQAASDDWLARALRRAGPQRPSVMARLAVVLHGPQHWVRTVGGILVGQVLVVAFLAAFMHWLGSGVSGEFLKDSMGIPIALVAMAIAPLTGLPRALWASRREQALLMLLPGVPQGAALNRALARQQMEHLLLSVLATLPALLAVAWWGQTSQVLAFYGATLPVAAMLWRDASHLRQPSPQPAFVPVPYLIVVAQGMAWILLLRWQPGWLWPWALGMVLLAAALLGWRWRRVSQWPQALPAGRLA